MMDNHLKQPTDKAWCRFRTAAVAVIALTLFASSAVAQSVCLPAPRLLTTKPMGGQRGKQIEVVITGQSIDGAELLLFSHPGIKATFKLDDSSVPVPNTYLVTIADDCPLGIHEARVMTRLGVSTSRVFNVGELPEVSQTTPNRTLETAMPIEINTVCNAAMSAKSVDFFSFKGSAGQRLIVDLAARGIESKLNPVVIVADENGNDLKVERRGGVIDFTPEADGTYIIKTHDLTFNGGAHYFYRLALTAIGDDDAIVRMPSTREVNAISWPPHGFDVNTVATKEAEPNNGHEAAQKITLPCDISGRFFPAADVDTYEFTAKKGDVWWVEVASERFGLPTDPSIVVQHIGIDGKTETPTDLVELTDIASPVKISSNGYSYDGPPYNAGSSDIIGKVEIKQDGLHRLHLRDLFGGTRKEPHHVYRMIVRKAQPDFAIVGWAQHMTLRNGDRNALSKPIALRNGETMPFEIVVIRRDGFNGPIDLKLDNLPDGVTATGLTIPAGQSRGHILINATENAPRGLTIASFTGTATINDEVVTRTGQFASMKWPVPNAWSEIPAPRLLADIPVSVGGSEQSPLTVAAVESKTWDVKPGEKLTIPLKHSRNCAYSGNKISLKTYGTGFDKNAAFDISIDQDNSEAVLDLAKLKVPTGDYQIAFYGTVVAKYRNNPQAVDVAKAALDALQKQDQELTEQVTQLSASIASATDAEKTSLQTSLTNTSEQQKALKAKITAAEKAHKFAETLAKPKDIADIIVSTPIHIRVLPEEKKTP